MEFNTKSGQEWKQLCQGSGGIRDRYTREKTIKRGVGSDEVYQSKWTLFTACRFQLNFEKLHLEEDREVAGCHSVSTSSNAKLH